MNVNLLTTLKYSRNVTIGIMIPVVILHYMYADMKSVWYAVSPLLWLMMVVYVWAYIRVWRNKALRSEITVLDDVLVWVSGVPCVLYPIGVILMLL